MLAPNAAEGPAYRPRLYSGGGIKLLSLLFSAIAGGWMTSANFKSINQPRAARMALWGSIAYTGAMLYLTSSLVKSPGAGWVSCLTGLAGGWVLEAYFKKHAPDCETLPVKSNWKPFAVCLLITALFGLAIYSLLKSAA